MRLPSLGCPLVSVLSALILPTLAVNAADIIYDNSSDPINGHYCTTFEYGDEIVLAKGTNHLMGQFLFEYYANFVPTGNETARLRLYINDGPLDAANPPTPTPGTELYDSGSFSIVPGVPPYYIMTKTITGLDVPLPGNIDITWTVQFSGLTGDEAGLVFRDPPTAGKSYDDIWIDSNGTWQRFTWNGNPKANFAARIISIDTTTVSVRRSGKQVIVEWPGTPILQFATNVNGPYTDISSARNKYTVDPAKAPSLFWRLRNY